MAVKLLTLDNDEILFNPSFRVQGLSITRRVPSFPIDGRDGEVTFDGMIAYANRTLTVSGMLYGETAADTQASLDYMMKLLRYKNDVRLYLDESDTTFYPVKFITSSHSFQEGTGRKVSSLSLTFTAFDPTRYGDSHGSEQDASGGSLTFTNAGNKAVMPVMWIVGKTVGGLSVANPVVTNTVTNDVVTFTGTVPAGQILLIKPKLRTAKMLLSIAHSGSAAAAGTNTLQLDATASATDEAYTGKTLRITSGAGAKQFVEIVAYNGPTKRATIDAPWDIIPGPGDAFEIWDTQGEAGSMGIDYLIYGFSLAPGDNALTITDTNSLSTLGMRYRDRWI